MYISELRCRIRFALIGNNSSYGLVFVALYLHYQGLVDGSSLAGTVETAFYDHPLVQ